MSTNRWFGEMLGILVDDRKSDEEGTQTDEFADEYRTIGWPTPQTLDVGGGAQDMVTMYLLDPNSSDP